ncbi:MULTISPECIES: glycerol-3-phosphate dehydrogenase/oxidase [unclassified Paenibacillus]|uniref:glycerol-3-phosphate dehydrogenase/oxidase n=1 Tax=unclassified Paenibacillus TaxID=185978 RepID=UPI000463F66D|nr:MULTISPECIES: FAD-dependent oxidoreductase [unclassified Paenibacillus]KGP83647.1 glycerol-3-phosphate dehydrogenase [Paenibacillus sp. MAEPY2]KGP87827.1 glycerol-3-phosphate dehydrogenase [Paenibacillus sp. MAEPY1]
MTASFSAEKRTEYLDRMANAHFDILIIGGGITGAGIALDAASRGLKTALVEMQDFAAGTSSRSTKLVHGGLRYLKQFEVKMVAEVGRERAVVYENGPHVTTPEPMLLPIYTAGTFGRFSTSIGLMVYDWLAGVKRSERRKMLNAGAVLDNEPLLRKDGLLGGGRYVEYRTDDARLTIEVMKEAVRRGVQAVNYVKAAAFLKENGLVTGIQAVDQISDQSYDLRATKVINASGPWVDELRKIDGSRQGKTLQMTKGIHLIFDGTRFPLRQAVYFDTPDGRMVFAVPREGKTYVGTTDTVFEDDPAHPLISQADRDYVIDAVNGMFPDVRIRAEDVESGWAGVRPLIHEEGKGPSEISRKDEVWVAPSGLITIAGGKLTGYRKMAEMVVDLAARQLEQETGRSVGPCITKEMPISGGDVGGSANFGAYAERKIKDGVALGLDRSAAERLARVYGSNVDALYERMPDPRAKAELHALPQELLLMLSYAIDEEMTVTPADFFVRRTGDLFFRIDEVRQYKAAVIQYMAERMDWLEEQVTWYTQELDQLLLEASGQI